ncbi:MAG: hypothetical protein NTX72_02755 [Candidatus Uhrbacteria bacterium]|nr:hypothetical protein [Candidatus Uhrbacteria bacterium]
MAGRHTCPNKGCRFTSNHSKSMEKHQQNTGHGREAGSKVFKGYVQGKSLNKPKAAKG